MAFFEENIRDWEFVAEKIRAASAVFITSHVNPDGDAIGSEMALAGFLEKMGKYYRVINHSPTPETFAFLDPDNIIEQFEDDTEFTLSPCETDLILLVDMGRYERCGSCAGYFENSSAMKIVIDHHPKEDIDVDYSVVNTDAASTGSLVYDLLNHIDASLISKDIALAVLTAVVTDSGYFRYGSTTATTHKIASSLYEHGADVISIRKRLENGYPFCRQKLMGYALSTLKSAADGQISYASITLDMFEEAGAKREHTDGIIDQIRYIYKTQVAILIIQEGDERFKVSFRSGAKVPVNRVASMLGGGGHPRAAGANLIGSLDEVVVRVLEAAESYLAD